MDNSGESFKLVSLCSGYCGLDLGISRILPTRTVAYSEIEAFAVSNLLAKIKEGKLDPAPIWTDLKTFPCDGFSGMVDILCGGYSCQPFSTAGKRRGDKDERHLWPYIRKIIGKIRPQLCVFENVRGHITLGLPKVLKDLERLGYYTVAGVFKAADVGAPHERARLFILAYTDSSRLQGMWNKRKIQEGEVTAGHVGSCGTLLQWPKARGILQEAWEPPRVAGENMSLNPDWVETLMGLPAGWTLDEYSTSESRLRLLGNGVVPKQAELAVRALIYDSLAMYK